MSFLAPRRPVREASGGPSGPIPGLHAFTGRGKMGVWPEADAGSWIMIASGDGN